MQNTPLISVVTVSYNAATTIEETILSVLNQTYSNIEYIIIDGGSTDGTVDIIRKYADRLAYWISEPDKGIYDAMNKGIAAASGDYINFMNAGDVFYDQDVIKNIFEKTYPNDCNVIYGKTLVHYRWGTYIVSPTDLSVLKKRMCLCHQSVFVRVSTHKANPFDTSFKITADYIFLHNLYEQTPDSFIYYPGVIANYDAIYGISAQNSQIRREEIHRLSHNKTIVGRLKHILRCVPINIPNTVHRVLCGLNRSMEHIKN